MKNGEEGAGFGLRVGGERGEFSSQGGLFASGAGLG